MDASGRRSGSGGFCRRRSRRTGVLKARLWLAALVVAALPAAAAAQKPPAAKPKPPAAKLAPVAPAPAPTSSNGQPLDLAFGAYQRGNYLTAFGLATRRVDETGDPKSMTLLGELYASGLGVPQDDKKAAEWYKLAADRGDREAMFALAMFRLTGRAGPRDRDASAKWPAAAKLGQPLAAYDLALLYIEGQLFPQDFSRAAELLRISAQSGNPEAQYALGTMYKTGRGVPKDMRQAVHLFGL